ncbi:MAG TPA: hypothetical protein PKZ39_06740, partial [Clostridia bacterium]|nr:hypothetical protein [Clostridia bacterium]
MKINKIFLLILVFLSLFLFSSCMTINQYGQNTDSFEVLYSGGIQKYKKNGTYTERDIVVNDRDKSGIEFERLVSGTVRYMKMDGAISLSDSVYTIKISYKQEFDDKDSIHSVRNIVVEGLPAMYQFTKFDISGTAVFIKKYIHEKDMPVVFTNFSIPCFYFNCRCG